MLTEASSFSDMALVKTFKHKQCFQCSSMNNSVATLSCGHYFCISCLNGQHDVRTLQCTQPCQQCFKLTVPKKQDIGELITIQALPDMYGLSLVSSKDLSLCFLLRIPPSVQFHSHDIIIQYNTNKTGCWCVTLLGHVYSLGRLQSAECKKLPKWRKDSKLLAELCLDQFGFPFKREESSGLSNGALPNADSLYRPCKIFDISTMTDDLLRERIVAAGIESIKKYESYRLRANHIIQMLECEDGNWTCTIKHITDRAESAHTTYDNDDEEINFLVGVCEFRVYK